MAADTIYIYTDASFSKTHEIAIIGHALFKNTQEHDTHSINDVGLNLIQIQESNNIRAELKGALTALQACPKGKRVLLYSDCQTLCHLPARRRKLERTNYISLGKNRKLANADLYQELYSIFDRLQPELIWLKGHTSNKVLNRSQEHFSSLDKEVRKRLRKIIACSTSTAIAKFQDRAKPE